MLGGVISNLLSLGAKLLSSSSSPSVESQRINDELRRLLSMVNRIKDTLYDAEQREIRDLSVRNWLKELKEVALDAEDVLDEYHYEVLSAEVKARDSSTPDSRKRKLIQVPDGMLAQIQQITSKFAEIGQDRIALRLFEEDGPRRLDREFRIAPTSHFVVESNIFGREKEKEEIVKLLSYECHDGKVISVVALVGTGGIGKTTLAQLVYNDERIQERFDMFGWICVSEDFDIQRLAKESVESLEKNTCDLTNLGLLQEKISETVEGKRVLLVLDDIWNENINLWESFHAPFMSASLVKILVTTRSQFVAQIMGTENTLNLEYLPSKQIWQLFVHYAFGGVNQNLDPNLVEIGKHIMKKCGMLPLAVKLIASLLRHDQDEESWREILESELWESDASDQIFKPLQISYTHLPTKLKPCFLYCSMFPKDSLYTIKDLVELWFYQGYIEANGKKNAEEIGRKYVEQLSDRSLLEEYNSSSLGSRSSYKLHDIVHDLARLNSDSEYCSIEACKARKLRVSPNKIYHLYVASSVKLTELVPFGNFTTLRTLIMGQYPQNCFSNFDLSVAQKLRILKIPEHQTYESEFLSNVGNLKHLRCLLLRNLLTRRLPKSICSLYKLEKLSLSNRYLEELPMTIGNLVSLEELTLDGCEKLKVLPESFCQLKALRHIELFGCCNLKELPSDFGSLTSLETMFIKDSVISSLPSNFNVFRDKLCTWCCNVRLLAG